MWSHQISAATAFELLNLSDYVFIWKNEGLSSCLYGYIRTKSAAVLPDILSHPDLLEFAPSFFHYALVCYHPRVRSGYIEFGGHRSNSRGYLPCIDSAYVEKHDLTRSIVVMKSVYRIQKAWRRFSTNKYRMRCYLLARYCVVPFSIAQQLVELERAVYRRLTERFT